MIESQASASFAVWLITGVITVFVVFLWWSVKRFINNTTSTAKSQAEAMATQHDSINLLHQRIEASQKAYDEDKKVTVKRLDAHSRAITKLGNVQVRHSTEIRHLKGEKKAS